MRAFFFIGKNYFKYFFIVFIALELFFVGTDSLKYAEKLPESANLVILFFFYNTLYAINYTLLLSLVLGGIIFYLTFLKSSQLTAMLALGYSKRKILIPPLVISSLFVCLYIGLNATPFVYAQEKAEAIVDQNVAQNARENIFVKYNQNYVFFQKVYPLLNKAEDIKVFELRDKELASFIQAKSAFFDGTFWNLSEAKVTNISPNLNASRDALKLQSVPNLKILENFRPKVLDTFSKEKPVVSIVDALVSIKILISQKIDFEKIRAILYGFILIPLFVPLCLVFIAYFIPPLSRYGNLPLLGFGSVIFSLSVWGIFFSASKLSVSGILNPEFAILVPLFCLFAVSLYCFGKINQT